MTRLSIHLGNFSADGAGGWEPMLERAVAADAAGIDRVLVSDHIAFGEDLSAYGDPTAGGTEGGRQPTGPDGHWLEPLTVLTAVAARTQRVRLGTMVLLAALRRPAVLAKTLSTLDVLSGGRVDLGVGVGWQAAEYAAAGLRYEGRGRLLDHTLAVCQALWQPGGATIDDELLSFEGIHQSPEPVQPGGIPIWVSGRMNANVIARVVRFGAGWIPWGADDGDPGPAIARLRSALEEAGRDPRSLLVLGGLPVIRTSDGRPDLAATVAGTGPLLEAGVTDFRIGWPVPSGVEAATDALGELVRAFRDAVA
jgi:probable F420-dependent oxidoreductase